MKKIFIITVITALFIGLFSSCTKGEEEQINVYEMTFSGNGSGKINNGEYPSLCGQCYTSNGINYNELTTTKYEIKFSEKFTVKTGDHIHLRASASKGKNAKIEIHLKSSDGKYNITLKNDGENDAVTTDFYIE